MTQQPWEVRLGLLIRERRGPHMSQQTLAQLVTDKAGRKVTQNLLSELERGNRWGGNVDLIGKFAEVLDIPWQEVSEIIGYTPPPDDGAPRQRTFAEIVSHDRTLSKAARNHLLNQYELLQMATQHERSGQPVLHDDAATDQKKRKRA